MKSSSIVAALLAVPAALAQSSSGTGSATTTIMTTHYTTYVYTVYDTTLPTSSASSLSSSTASSGYPYSSYAMNTTVVAPTGPGATGGTGTVPGATGTGGGISPSIVPQLKSGAVDLKSNWMLGAAAAGLVAAAVAFKRLMRERSGAEGGERRYEEH